MHLYIGYHNAKETTCSWVCSTYKRSLEKDEFLKQMRINASKHNINNINTILYRN
jgi:hypothetical protein